MTPDGAARRRRYLTVVSILALVLIVGVILGVVVAVANTTGLRVANLVLVGPGYRTEQDLKLREGVFVRLRPSMVMYRETQGTADRVFFLSGVRGREPGSLEVGSCRIWHAGDWVLIEDFGKPAP